MRSKPNHPLGQSRRQFIRNTSAAALVTSTGLLSVTPSAFADSSRVAIVLDPADPLTHQPPVRWAAEQLRNALTDRKVAAQIVGSISEASAGDECIAVSGFDSDTARSIAGAGQSLPKTPEALALGRGKIGGRKAAIAAGSDARGLVYALLELADRIAFAKTPLAVVKDLPSVSEKPANKIRSVARLFASDVEDKSWYQDRQFWQAYLSMLAAQRFNRFHLVLGLAYDFTTGIRDCYFHFAYPFLLSVPGYENVRAVPLPNEERDNNLALLKFISAETVRRGIHFQLGLWTHAYEWTNSPNANYRIAGLTPETNPAYCRDALRLLLAECPDINGITFRIHGESGIAEGNYNLWKTIFDGVAQCGRRVEVDMHAKGMDQGMIDVALATGQPVNISPKFWAEHMGLPYMQGAIRQLEMPPAQYRENGFFSRSSGSRSFLRYGYGDLLAENRKYGVLHRIWPGTQRTLLWGDPETAAGYGRAGSFCDSVGVEWMEPLSFKGRKGSGLPGGRNACADPNMRPEENIRLNVNINGPSVAEPITVNRQFDFTKHLYSYRVWGRCLYNPDGDGDGWRRLFKQQFESASASAEASLASASQILPLVTTAHCPSAANNNYWPEMYTNMPIVDASRPHPYGDSPAPRRFGTVSSLDPEFFLTIEEFADELLKNSSSGKYSPAWVAARLDAAAALAKSHLQQAKSKSSSPGDPEFRWLVTDVAIQIALGRFFAAKFRAGVLFALYERSHEPSLLNTALITYRTARDSWTEAVAAAKDVYLPDITYGYDRHLRGHWSNRLQGIDTDIADMEARSKSAPAENTAKTDAALLSQAVRAILNPPAAEPALALSHTPPKSFSPGSDVKIEATVKGGAPIQLRYRHINQAEVWQSMEMKTEGSTNTAVIPANYTNSPFPLQYHFAVRVGENKLRLFPGLSPGWQTQPYFILRQA